ncbi:MAG: transposase [Magnetococcus sp. WYHC-3]
MVFGAAVPGGWAVILKEGKEIASDSLQSPFDPDASYDGYKGVGYQAQLSETCGAGNPINVITRVEVEPAHVSDQHAIVPALDDLAAREIAPEEMFADTAYNSGDNLLEAAERGVELMAPTPGKADPDGINLGHFDLDLKKLRVNACPEGRVPVRNKLGRDGRTRNLRFDAEACAACPLSADCPAGRHGGRLRVHPRDIATAYSRVREESDAFKKAYAIRAGIESVNAALKTAHGLDKVWTRGLPRVSFAVKMKALASNVKRFLRHSCAQLPSKSPEMVPIAA